MAGTTRLTITLAADTGVGGYNATPTGVHTPGEVNSIVMSGGAAGVPLIYVSDSTATGANAGDLAKIRGIGVGIDQILFDPPIGFQDGLMVNVSATGNAGEMTVYWTPRASQPYQA